MGRRLLVVLILAAMIAAGVFYFARMAQQSAQPQVVTAPAGQAPQLDTQGVMVAAKDMPSGTIIQASMLVFRQWPKESVDKESYVLEGSGSLDDYNGAVVRSGVRSGEPVARANIVKRGESGFMAAVLKPGMRAVSFPVNPNTGVAGFVFPGDQVDLVLSHVVNLGDENGQVRAHNVSETVLQDIRVVGIDQRAGDQEQVPAVGAVATLEVTPEQAEKISLAQRMGELRLVLRPLSKTEPADGAATAAPASEASVQPQSVGATDAAGGAVDNRTFTLDSDLSQIIAAPGGTDTENKTVTSVQVIRGSSVSDAPVK